MGARVGGGTANKRSATRREGVRVSNHGTMSGSRLSSINGLHIHTRVTPYYWTIPSLLLSSNILKRSPSPFFFPFVGRDPFVGGPAGAEKDSTSVDLSRLDPV